MSQKTSKPGQNLPKQRGLYTPSPVRDRVIARHISGESNRRIASEEGIDRETVGRILSQKEVALMKGQSQALLFSLVPEAIKALGEVFRSDDLRLKAAIGMKLLECLQVFPNRGEHLTPQPDPEERRLLILGGLVDMGLKKCKKYNLPRPPGVDGLEEEVQKRLEGVEEDRTPRLPARNAPSMLV
jgi:hypothetical protein